MAVHRVWPRNKLEWDVQRNFHTRGASWIVRRLGWSFDEVMKAASRLELMGRHEKTEDRPHGAAELPAIDQETHALLSTPEPPEEAQAVLSQLIRQRAAAVRWHNLSHKSAS